MILVIGGTGHIGREVLPQLHARGVPVRAMVRDPYAAHLPSGVETARGDLTVPETLDGPLDAVDTVFLLWVAPRDAVAPALDRIVKRARRIVFLSSPHKTPHPFFQQPNPSAALHAHIEELIERSGVEWTFLRPGMLAGNALRWWAPRIRAGDAIRWPYLSVPTAPIHERDIARVAAKSLCEAGHAGREYVLTGSQSLTQFEQISTIGRAIGRPLRIEEITPEVARRERIAGMPEPVIDMLLNAWAAGAGRPAYVTSTVADITGTPARTFLEWATEYRSEFLP